MNLHQIVPGRYRATNPSRVVTVEDPPESFAGWVLVTEEDGSTNYCPPSEMEPLEKEEGFSVHSCHDGCMRPACVARREGGKGVGHDQA